jgi:hypothetical protein
MRKVLQEGKRRPSLHIVDQIRHHILYKAKLDTFREKMLVHRKSTSEMSTLIGAQTHLERRASVVKLGSYIEEQESKQGGLEEGSWKSEVLECLDEQAVYENEGDERGTVEVLETLKDGLVARGHEEEKVDEQMGYFWSVMKDTQPIDSQHTTTFEASQLERFKF